jgi:hypothetical protein
MISAMVMAKNAPNAVTPEFGIGVMLKHETRTGFLSIFSKLRKV